MVYRRRRTFRRKRTTRNTTYRRRFRRGTRYNKRGQKVYMFSRHVDYGALSINNLSNTYRDFNFSLADVPGFAEFTALYDMYKINAVKLMFLPSQTVNNSLSSVNNAAAYARFFSVLDFNAPPASWTIDDLRQYKTCKFTTILRRHKRYLKPRIMDSSSTYTPGRPWISTTSTGTNYYGVLVGVEPIDSTGVTTMDYTVEAKFYMSFKNTK